MPTYEYECSGCRETYDVLQKMSDPALTACIKCASSKVKKKLSVPTILLRRTQPPPTIEDRGRPISDALPRRVAVGNYTEEGLSIDALPPEFRHPNLGLAPVIEIPYSVE